MDPTGIATDIAKGIASNTIAAVIKQIKDVVELDQSLQLLNTDFAYMNSILLSIDQQFQEQQRGLPNPIEECLTRMSDHLKQGQLLINRAKQQRTRCFGFCLLCNRNLFSQITDWKTRFDQLFQELERVFSIFASAQQIVAAAPSQQALRHEDVPHYIVGSAIESAKAKLHTLLTEPAHTHARVIAIYGMGGVGKTTLMKVIYNNYKEQVKEQVSRIFDIVLWHVVSQYQFEAQDDKIRELQLSIAHQLNLDVKDCPTLDIRKMRLSESLKNRRFLLLLDDLWKKIDLDRVGVTFVPEKGSKVLISSRSRDVVKAMGASDHYSLMMRPLSQEDGWELFRRKAFANGDVPEKDIETTAKEIAGECKGLPLALNVVAAALGLETDLYKWRDALTFMRNVDPSFPDTHSTIDTELYNTLRWSYKDLSDHLKSCFLYCAAFPEDAKIDMETLVEMWAAEGWVIPKGKASLMDVGRQYIDALAIRCLIEYVGVEYIQIPYAKNRVTYVQKEVIKVHDVLRDMAIYIGEREEDWVFATGQHLQNFSRGEVSRRSKRLAVGQSDIEEIPRDLECTDILSLVLAQSQKLRRVPAPSLLNITSLKVLDLSCTLITSLPTSVGQLGQLEFLNLSGCYRLNKLPESICMLSRLQFLNLDFCPSLISLPDKIGELKSLKHFKWSLGSDKSVVIPRHISGLTSLTKLCLPKVRGGSAISMEDVMHLSNLMELSILIKAHTMSDCQDSRWLKMRKLELWYRYDHERIYSGGDSDEYIYSWADADADGDEDDVVEDALPPQNMHHLQSLKLVDDGSSWGDAKAERDVAADAHGDEDDVVEDAVMVDALPPQNMHHLQSLYISLYQGVSLPSYICKFQNLEELKLSGCWELRELPVWEMGSDSASGSFPMLKRLWLYEVDKLESIAGPANVLKGGTMSKLQQLTIRGCPLLKRLPIGVEKLGDLKEIRGWREWWSKLIWKDEDRRVQLQPLFKPMG